MSYKILLERRALKFINKQPSDQKKRILSAIYKLPTEGDFQLLAGAEKLYRLRVGDYRVIYTIEDSELIVRVINVGNRGQIYKNL